MDKKELQNLIDRISLTGPEGIKKAKRALREIVQNSEDIQKKAEEDIQKAQEQVNNDLLDDEYTIAQAINDLNERIVALESAPAPQPETHILEIIGYTSSDELDIDVALSKLLYDGHEPTFNELLEVDFRNVIIRRDSYDLLPVSVRKNEGTIAIVAGGLYDQHEAGVKAIIELTTSPSAIAEIYQVVDVYEF